MNSNRLMGVIQHPVYAGKVEFTYLMKGINYLSFRWWIPAVLFVFVSCQKEPDVPRLNSGPGSDSFDSTQLIKDVKLKYYDLNGQVDSITETFTYDTINHKIISIFAAPSDPDFDGFSVVYGYTPDHLLTSIVYHYPPGSVPDPNDGTGITIDYDNDGIPQKIVFEYVSNPSYTIHYIKTIEGAGYRLTWENKDTFTGWIYKYTSLFNGNNKCIKYQEDYVVTNTNGDRTDSLFLHIDSIVYNSAGDLQKVYRNDNSIPGPPPPQYLYYEFGTRYDKGNQLSNQRKLLFNGVENIPFDSQNQDWFYLSVLNSFYDVYSAGQFGGFPCKTSLFDDNSSLPENITHDASFDSLNRLVSFTGALYGAPEDKEVWEITYYK